jgi:N-acylneuraminate cytidylyltransferase
MSTLFTTTSPPYVSWIAIIPLRNGSKGLPGKNTKLLAGKPLYCHAVDEALAAGASRVIISTDIAEVLNALHPAGVETMVRPSHLCGDTVEMTEVLQHIIKTASLKGTVVLLQATSPLRNATHIKESLSVFASQNYELVLSVTQAERSILKWGFLQAGHFKPVSNPAFCFSNRQQLPPIVRPNGALYLFDAQWFANNGGFVSDKIGAFEMSANVSLDIDTLDDFLHCEQAIINTNQT